MHVEDKIALRDVVEKKVCSFGFVFFERSFLIDQCCPGLLYFLYENFLENQKLLKLRSSNLFADELEDEAVTDECKGMDE
jgi:hypothetical protein